MLSRLFARKPHYAFDPSHIVVSDFAEFSGQPIGEVVEKIAAHQELNARDWHGNHETFYENSQNYIYDTLSANLSQSHVLTKLDHFNPEIAKAICRSGSFVDFGAGVGITCEISARAGSKATYIDVPGLVFDFAKWRFQKYDRDVNCIAAKPGTFSIPGKFNVVFTDAVIEHFPTDEQITATEILANAVDKNGALVYLVDLSGPTPQEPMHFHVDIRDLHDRIENCGLNCTGGRGTFCSIWHR